MVEGYAQLEKLAAAKLGVPMHTTSRDQATTWSQAGASVWGRLNNHTQGRDIRTTKSPEWALRVFWVKQIPADAIIAEWRLHVFNGQSIARGRKSKVENIAKQLSSYVRSRRNGWRLLHTDEPPQGAKFYAKNATKALSYLWGAVDMLQVDLARLPKDCIQNYERLETSLAKSNLQPFVVLEVNQMPGMDNYTATAYANSIARYAPGDAEKIL
jgi:hypothetical protein